MASNRRIITKSTRWGQCLHLGCLALFGLFSLGCATPGKGLNVFAPYRGAPNGEEYRSPPADDARFTQAPSYPSHLLKPVVKVKDEETGSGLKRAPIGSSGMMPMGGNSGQPY